MIQTSIYSLATRERSWLRDLFLVVGGSILIALFAPISIHLPFTPVPIVLQNYVCLLLAVMLGARRGALAVLLYLFQGAVGFPVFAMGKCGFFHLLGPTGGYLIGYALAAYAVGYLVERMENPSPRKAVLAMAAGSMIIFLCGVSQLSLFLGLKSAIVLGVLPFLAGDLIKLMLAYQAVKALRFSK